jgi:lipoyl-dependent peroxiredoxin
MPMRKAHARWEGTLKEGKGQVDFGNGLFKGAYSFASRFEDGAAAAKAGCPVSQALAGTEITLEARLVA